MSEINYPKVTISREEVRVGDAVIPANVVNGDYRIERSSRGPGVAKLTLEIFVSGVEQIGGTGNTVPRDALEISPEGLAQLVAAFEKETRLR